MIYAVLYPLFFFFAHKQTYAGSHFTGADKKVGVLLSILGFVNFLAGAAFLVYTTLTVSLLFSVSLLSEALVVVYILNLIISKIVMKGCQKQCKVTDPYFLPLYNRKCDVVTTMTALVGTVCNIIIIIVFIFVR